MSARAAAKSSSFHSLASTLFTPSSTGNCRYQKAGDDTWAAQILGKLREINKRRDS